MPPLRPANQKRQMGAKARATGARVVEGAPPPEAEQALVGPDPLDPFGDDRPSRTREADVRSPLMRTSGEERPPSALRLPVQPVNVDVVLGPQRDAPPLAARAAVLGAGGSSLEGRDAALSEEQERALFGQTEAVQPSPLDLSTQARGPHDLGRGVRDGNATYASVGDYLEAQAKRLLYADRAAPGGAPRYLPTESGTPEVRYDRPVLSQPQAYALANDQFQQLLARGQESERLGLEKSQALQRAGMDQARLGLDKERVGVEAQRLALEKALGMGRLDVDRGRLDLEKGLGYGKLGLDSQKSDLDRELGVGRLGLEKELGRGGLEVSQRKQMGEEHKLARELEAEARGEKALDAMAVSGRPQDEIKDYWEMRQGVLGRRQPAFQPGAPFGRQPGAPQVQPPAQEGQPRQEQPPKGSRLPKGQEDAFLGGQGAPDDNARFKGAFGGALNEELRGIRTGKTGGQPNEWAGKSEKERMLAAAKLLARRMDRPENAGKPEVGQAMADYMKQNYGGEFDRFVRPTEAELEWQGLTNAFRSEPTEEEALSSQYRALMGVQPRRSSGMGKVGQALLRSLPWTAAASAVRRLRGGKPEGRSTGGHILDVLGEMVPGVQFFK